MSNIGDYSIFKRNDEITFTSKDEAYNFLCANHKSADTGVLIQCRSAANYLGDYKNSNQLKMLVTEQLNMFAKTAYDKHDYSTAKSILEYMRDDEYSSELYNKVSAKINKQNSRKSIKKFRLIVSIICLLIVLLVAKCRQDTSVPAKSEIQNTLIHNFVSLSSI